MPSPALTALLAPAFAQAQGLLGDRFMLNGTTYTGVLRAANAFEMASIEREMQGNGFRDCETMILTVTRDQFDFDPVIFRRKLLTLLSPSPKSCTIQSVATQDQFHYVFTLLYYQPRP